MKLAFLFVVGIASVTLGEDIGVSPQVQPIVIRAGLFELSLQPRFAPVQAPQPDTRGIVFREVKIENNSVAEHRVMWQVLSLPSGDLIDDRR
jgi:hypothetical protein